MTRFGKKAGKFLLMLSQCGVVAFFAGAALAGPLQAASEVPYIATTTAKMPDVKTVTQYQVKSSARVKNVAASPNANRLDPTPYQCGLAPDIPLSDLSLSSFVPLRLKAPVDIDAVFAEGPAGKPQIAAMRLADIAVIPAMQDAVLAFMQRHYRDVVAVVPPGQKHLADIGSAAPGQDPRHPVYFVMQDGGLWQEHLVGAGLAMVLPVAGLDANGAISLPVTADGGEMGGSPAAGAAGVISRHAIISRLVAREEKARRAGIGMWAPGLQKGTTTDRRYFFSANPVREKGALVPFAGDGKGQFAIVQGRLKSVEMQKYRAYLNFGADWRHDFTIALDRTQIGNLARAGVAPTDWVGRTIIVRGMIENRGGPYVAPNDLTWVCVGGVGPDNN
jgi:hypothetical protein